MKHKGAWIWRMGCVLLALALSGALLAHMETALRGTKHAQAAAYATLVRYLLENKRLEPAGGLRYLALDWKGCRLEQVKREEVAAAIRAIPALQGVQIVDSSEMDALDRQYLAQGDSEALQHGVKINFQEIFLGKTRVRTHCNLSSGQMDGEGYYIALQKRYGAWEVTKEHMEWIA